MSSSSQAPESWISAFCSLVGHEYFAEVSEDFIEDDFNLTGLQSQVPMYKEALEMILDVEPEDASDEEDEEEEDEDEDEDEMQDGLNVGRGYRRDAVAEQRRHYRMSSDLNVIESSAELLYGLIHQRFITSRPGIQQMAEKYELNHFGHCPRVYCHGAKVLPVGCSDIPGQETVKLFCPSCLDVYSPPNSRFQTVDGAFFGTTFGCLFFMTFPDLDVGGQRPPPLPQSIDPSPASSTGNGPPDKPPLRANGSSSSATAAAPPQQPDQINGVNPKNLAPGLGPGSIYEPRIYGFRVSEIAKTGPRMKWLRGRPTEIEELDECHIWAVNQEPPTESEMADDIGGVETGIAGGSGVGGGGGEQMVVDDVDVADGVPMDVEPADEAVGVQRRKQKERIVLGEAPTGALVNGEGGSSRSAAVVGLGDEG